MRRRRKLEEINENNDSFKISETPFIGTIENILPSNNQYTEYIKKTELFDVKAMYSHIYSGYVDIDYANELLDYVNRSIIFDKKSYINAITVTYEIPYIGRLKPFIYDEKQIKSVKTQTNHWNYTKYEICRNLYNDIDIVNCQSTLLEQLMQYNNLETKHISQFNKKREKILKDLMAKNNSSRKDAKKLIITLTYASEHDIIKQLKSKNISKIINSYVLQMLKNRKVLLERYPQFKEESIKRHQDDNYYNLEGSAYALLGQTLERYCLLAINDFFIKNNREVGALIHDGVHLLKKQTNLEDLKKCEAYVYSKTKFNIKLKIKSFEEPIERLNKIHFNTLTVKEDDKFMIKPLNVQYLTKLQKNNVDINTNFGQLDNNDTGYPLENDIEETKINLILSYTGSAKTQCTKNVTKRFSNYKILSLVSRVSLADMHATEFDIVSYKKASIHGLDEVYQTDSIDKINNINEPYILIIDEIASLCSHFLNNMNKMSNNRILFVKKFADLINNENCKLVMGVDANINDGTITFLKELSNKQIILYYNKFTIERKAPVNVYHNKINCVNNVIKFINNGEKVFLASNMNNEFKRQVVDVVIRNCNLTKNDYLLYSGDEGEKKIDTKLWQYKKLIVATPSIIYGCDSNYKFHVFGFYYKGLHFDAMDINQQLNRERQPSSINLYIEDMRSTPYITLEDTIKNSKSDMNITYSIKMLEILEYIKALRNLFYYEEYRKSYHNNLSHHVLDLLRSKGYTNINHIIDKCIDNNLKPLSKLCFQSKINEQYATGIIDNKKSNDITDKLQIFKLDYFDKEFNDENNWYSYDDNVKQTYLNIITNHMNVFTNTKKFRQLLTYCIYKNNMLVLDKSSDTLNGKIYNLNNFDIPELILKSTKYKFQLLSELKDILQLITGQECKQITSKNFNDKINISNELIKNIIKAFNYRGQLFELNRVNLTSFYMSKMRQLLGDCITNQNKNKKVTITSEKGSIHKKYSINTWNDELIKLYDSICDIPKYYNQYLKNNKEYMFTDY